jgi:hypothetical protein
MVVYMIASAIVTIAYALINYVVESILEKSGDSV